MPVRLISKYTKETFNFIGQPIRYLLKKQSLLLFVAVAVTECAFSSAAWGLPLYLQELGKDSGTTTLGIELAIITATYFLVSLTTASFFGSFSDRFGRRPFLIIGTALAGISFIIFPIMYPVYAELPLSFVVLVIANGIKGLAVAMISGPVLAVFADLSPDEHHGETMGKFYLAKSAGGAIGYPFGLITWTIFQEDSFFFFAIVMFLATSIYLFRFFEPRRDLVLVDEAETMLTDFTQIVKDSDLDINPFKTMLESLQDKQFRKFAIAWLAYTTLIGASAFVAPVIIVELVTETGFLIAVIGFLGICIMGIMQPLLGKLSDNVGRKPFLVIGVVGTSMLLVTLASILDYKSINGKQEWELSEISDLIRNPFSITDTISLGFVPEYPFPIPHIFVLLMIAVFGLSASCFASAALGLVSDVTKSEHRGREMGLTQSLGAMGNIIGAIVGGYYIGLGPEGIIGLFTFCFGLSLIAIVIIVLFLYETSGFYHFTHKLV
ncbi:MAG: MFS transporter [Candidatus Heimdallarchaeota archaeon]|nr:MAG: MFS transporter [Candidatus Heimdallarchaeota archaeon]